MINIGEQVMGTSQTATKIDLNSGGPIADYSRHKQDDVQKGEFVDFDAMIKCKGRL